MRISCSTPACSSYASGRMGMVITEGLKSACMPMTPLSRIDSVRTCENASITRMKLSGVLGTMRQVVQRGSRM